MACLVGVGAIVAAPEARGDNKRLNRAVIQNVYTIQQQAGCTTKIMDHPQLRLAAQWHANDVLRNRNVNHDIGSDGSTPQDRANAAGFRGRVAQTVAINPALAINNMDVLRQWYFNPATLSIIQDCAHTAIGVWSENSWDRSVLVAVYGQPE
ncbi:CAP domain-containing protein [Mycolicibacterium elephantis]|uniref:CAP domain-containing protein n=1 Tax=Mycolicibacterium elephantis TaxID=81858 RepID=UPI000FE241D0|nr:CAP domain-containing protein [Mycolicibacterium elephantis]